MFAVSWTYALKFYFLSNTLVQFKLCLMLSKKKTETVKIK